MKIAPSILSANFLRLGEEVKKVCDSGADMIHVDVMDGHFVLNISVGVPVVKSLAPEVKVPLDVHLMIENPEKYIDAFSKALKEGGRDTSQDFIVVHAEACGGEFGASGGLGSSMALSEALKLIKSKGVKAGFSVKPGTPIEKYEDVLPLANMVLIMTVEPGFGGQKFMEDMMKKVKWLHGRKMLSGGALAYEIEVDGGVNAETAMIARDAGAEVLVAGTYIFGSKDYKETIKVIKT